MLCFNFQKRHMKGETDIAPMDFAEYLRKSVVSERTAKFIKMKDIVILVKVDERQNILKSLLATGYWSRHQGGTG